MTGDRKYSSDQQREILQKHRASRIEKKAPRTNAAQRQIPSLDRLIDSRTDAALRAFAGIFAKREATHVHQVIDKAVAKLRDELNELRAGLLKDLGEVISAEATLNREADRRNALMIVAASTAEKRIIYDVSGRPCGLAVVNDNNDG
jgi:hypothetical protein